MPGRLMSIRITSGWVSRASSMPIFPSATLSRRMSGTTRDELLDQLQVGRVVLYIEQGAQRRYAELAPGRQPWVRLRRRQVVVQPPGSVRSRTHCPSRQCFPRRSRPPISSTSRLLTTRPMPVPSSALTSCPRRLNGRNSCASFLGDNPSPVSRTLMRMRSAVLALHVTSTVPPRGCI